MELSFLGPKRMTGSRNSRDQKLPLNCHKQSGYSYQKEQQGGDGSQEP